MLQLYPEKYDQLELSVDEKSFLRTLERAFSNEEMAYYVLKINPRRKDAGDGKQPELFNLLLVNKGILLFRFIDAPNEMVAQMSIKAIGNPTIYNVILSDIRKRLEESRYLTNKAGNLRFALNVCLVFSKFDENQVLTDIDASERQFCAEHVIFNDTIMQIQKTGAEALDVYLKQTDELQEDQINIVFQRLCPEITIPHKYMLHEDETVEGVDEDINTSDRAVQSYRLDKKQIDIINKIAKGNQLILACAGSGKSVLLIAKCFKLASLNPSEQFLITCYNRNLNNGKPMSEVVGKGDWKTNDFSKPQSIKVNFRITESQYAKIRFGLRPLQMEDKWFVYFGDGRIHLHRSWTGAKIYEAAIKKDNDCYTITELTVERDAELYSNTNDSEDVRSFHFLIGRGMLGLNVDAPISTDSDESVLQGWSSFGRMIL